MNRHGTVRTMGAALLALPLGVLTAAPASSQPLDPDVPRTTSDRAVDPQLPDGLLAALQRDLGLTPERARARIAAEAEAVGVEEQLRDELGVSFAGAWFDPVGNRLVVSTTNGSLAGAIRAAGAGVRVVDDSVVDLTQDLDRLNAAATTAPLDGVLSWGTSPFTNSVVVTATDQAQAQDFLARAGVAGPGVRIEVATDAPRLYDDIIGGEGIRSGSGQCSVGFSARSATAAYVLTAGHCTELGGTWTDSDYPEPIGNVAASSFPGNDFGAIEVRSDNRTRPTARVYGAPAVAGAQEAPVGASVCRSGSTTGYRCGTVISKDQTVNYGGGDVVNGLTETTACAEPGDSGGSVVSGAQAQGLTSGGSGDCSGRGGATYFQPLDEVLVEYDLTLVTG